MVIKYIASKIKNLLTATPTPTKANTATLQKNLEAVAEISKNVKTTVKKVKAVKVAGAEAPKKKVAKKPAVTVAPKKVVKVATKAKSKKA